MKGVTITKLLSSSSQGTETVLPLGKQRVTKVMLRISKLMNPFLHYCILLSLSFVFVYPVLFLISQSLMSPEDILDGTVRWIPKDFSLKNFAYAFEHMNYLKTFSNSVIVSVGGALFQLIGCSIAGYGLARYRFPGYSLVMVLLLLTFLVPPQTIVVPLYLFFGAELGWLNTYYPILVPNLFGHGLRGALFVLVFMQFFRGLPHQMEEAARIDGAGAFRTFRSIMLPMAKPAVLVVLLFSIVWHWNDSYFPNLYVNDASKHTLNQSLSAFQAQNIGAQSEKLDESDKNIGQLPTNFEKRMAAALLTILPILLLYLYTQKHFVEGVERSGIAGE